MRKLKKLAWLLAIILLLQGILPTAEAHAFENEYPPSDTQLEESLPAPLQEEDTFTEHTERAFALEEKIIIEKTVEWPKNMTVLPAGTFETLYRAQNGKGYGFSFWLDDGSTVTPSEASLQKWDTSDIRIRIDQGDAYSCYESDAPGAKAYADTTYTYFAGGYLDDTLETGGHVIDIAVKKDNTWYTGNLQVTLADEGLQETIPMHKADEYNYFSGKKGGTIKDFCVSVNMANASDSVRAIGLYRHGSTVLAAAAKVPSMRVQYSFNAHYVPDTYSWGESDAAVHGLKTQLQDEEQVLSMQGIDFQLENAVEEGWYDIILTNASGLTTTISYAYYATHKPVVLRAGWRYSLGDILLPGKNSSYISAYIYGLNLSASDYPTYYDAETAVTSFTPGNLEALCEGEGYTYLLQKNDADIWNSPEASLTLSLKMNNENTIYADGAGADGITVPYGAIYGYDFYSGIIYLSADWIKDATDLGIAEYNASDAEQFTESCAPQSADANGNVFIISPQSITTAPDFFLSGGYYRAYRVIDGTIEYSDPLFYTSNRDMQLLIDSATDATYTENTSQRFSVFSLDGLKELASGEWQNGQTLDEALSVKGHQAIYGQKTVRVLFYNTDGSINRKQLYADFTQMAPVTITSLTLSSGSLTMEKEKMAVLTATISPPDATNTKLAWSSSDPAVAAVSAPEAQLSQSSIASATAGSDIVYAASADSSSDTVYAAPADSSSDTVYAASADSSFDTVYAASADNSFDTIYTTSIDSDGNVTITIASFSAGTATITVTALDGSGVSASCLVTVTEASGGENPPPKDDDDDGSGGDGGSGNDDSDNTGSTKDGDDPKPGPSDDKPTDNEQRSGQDSQVYFKLTSDSTVTSPVYQGEMLKGQKYTLGNGFWTTSDKSIVSVSEKSGALAAKRPGTAVITNALTKTRYRITVCKPSISLSSLTALVGNDSQEIQLSNKGSMAVSWISLNPSVAAVSETSDANGNSIAKIKGVGKGKTKIMAYIGGKGYAVSVTVRDIPPRTALADTDSVEINVLQSYAPRFAGKFRASKAVWTDTSHNMLSQDADNNWVDETGIIKISKAGRITGISVGDITVIGQDNKGREITLTVHVRAIPVKADIYLLIGQKTTLKHTYVNGDNVTWTTPGTNIVELTNTNKPKVAIQGIAKGETIITCNYNNILYKTTVHVEEPSLTTDSTLKQPNPAVLVYQLVLEKGDTYSISQPGVYQPVLFQSRKKKIAFVNEYGVLSACDKGVTVISAKVNGKGIKINVTVTEPNTSPQSARHPSS